MANKLDEVFEALNNSFTPEGVIEWFHRSRINLGNKTPNQAICEGNLEAVWKLAMELNRSSGL